MGVIAEIKECKEKKATFDGEIEEKRKVLAKCAAKRAKLGDASAEGAAEMLSKIATYEGQITEQIEEITKKMARLKEKKKGLAVRFDELEAAEAAKKEAAAAKSKEKRIEREAEKAAEKAAAEAAEAEARAAKKARKEKEKEGGSLTHLLLEDPDAAKGGAGGGSEGADKAGGKRGAADAADEDGAAGAVAGRAVKRVKMDDDDDDDDAAGGGAGAGGAGGGGAAEEEEDEEAKAAKAAAKAAALEAATQCAATINAELAKADGASASPFIDDEALAKAFETLESLPMDVDTLATSGVGKAINKMRKSTAATLAAYVERAKVLLGRWKALAAGR